MRASHRCGWLDIRFLLKGPSQSRPSFKRDYSTSQQPVNGTLAEKKRENKDKIPDLFKPIEQQGHREGEERKKQLQVHLLVSAE